MKYITPGEAAEYISVKDDVLGYPTEYFTRVPCLDNGCIVTGKPCAIS